MKYITDISLCTKGKFQTESKMSYEKSSLPFKHINFPVKPLN